jgi:cytochrome P450
MKDWSRRLLGLDSTYYHDDPTRFLPERFMNDDLEKPLEGHWGFGLGRRVCAGYLLATKNLWIAIAKMAYCFDIETTELFSSCL